MADCQEETFCVSHFRSLPHTEMIARFEGVCKLCSSEIKKEEVIIGGYANVSNTWDCKTMCGAPPVYSKDAEGRRIRMPCNHSSGLHWVHLDCDDEGPLGPDDLEDTDTDTLFQRGIKMRQRAEESDESEESDSEDWDDLDGWKADQARLPPLSVGELAKVKQGIKPRTRLTVQVLSEIALNGNVYGQRLKLWDGQNELDLDLDLVGRRVLMGMTSGFMGNFSVIRLRGVKLEKAGPSWNMIATGYGLLYPGAMVAYMRGKIIVAPTSPGQVWGSLSPTVTSPAWSWDWQGEAGLPAAN